MSSWTVKHLKRHLRPRGPRAGDPVRVRFQGEHAPGRILHLEGYVLDIIIEPPEVLLAVRTIPTRWVRAELRRHPEKRSRMGWGKLWAAWPSHEPIDPSVSEHSQVEVHLLGGGVR